MNSPLNLHVFELFDSVLCVSLADLSKSLVLVTALLYIFQMEEIQSSLLGIITGGGQVGGQGLNIGFKNT